MSNEKAGVINRQELRYFQSCINFPNIWIISRATQAWWEEEEVRVLICCFCRKATAKHSNTGTLRNQEGVTVIMIWLKVTHRFFGVKVNVTKHETSELHRLAQHCKDGCHLTKSEKKKLKNPYKFGHIKNWSVLWAPVLQGFAEC